MSLEFLIHVESEEEGALRIPYRRKYSAEHQNHGFTDLRGNPTAAAQISEAQSSPALTSMLVALAAAEAPLYSVGCDTGSGQHAEDEAHAGGYIQVVFGDPRKAAWLGSNKIAAHQLRAALEKSVGDEEWRVGVTVSRVGLEALGGPYVGFSLVIDHAALGRTIGEARASYERLVEAITEALLGEEIGG